MASSLHPVEMAAIKAGVFRKPILREALGQAEFPYPLTDYLVSVLQYTQARVYAALKHPA